MTTWIALWPLLAVPCVLMIAIGAVPSLLLGVHEIGGAAVRNWCVVHLLLDWLPGDARVRLLVWFDRTDALRRWAFYLLIAINVNALLLPVLYGVGEAALRLQAWAVRRQLETQSRAARTGR
ncbi:MAG: hypothetical protein M0Z84_01610 [Gammaproteobacteria bacterium]|nr:hypothetical protein [Gammaproteobacteria bacterium]